MSGVPIDPMEERIRQAWVAERRFNPYADRDTFVAGWRAAYLDARKTILELQAV